MYALDPRHPDDRLLHLPREPPPKAMKESLIALVGLSHRRGRCGRRRRATRGIPVGTALYSRRGLLDDPAEAEAGSTGPWRRRGRSHPPAHPLSPLLRPRGTSRCRAQLVEQPPPDGVVPADAPDEEREARRRGAGPAREVDLCVVADVCEAQRLAVLPVSWYSLENGVGRIWSSVPLSTRLWRRFSASLECCLGLLAFSADSGGTGKRGIIVPHELGKRRPNGSGFAQGLDILKGLVLLVGGRRRLARTTT